MREGDSMEKSEERNKIISKLQTVIKEQIELKEIIWNTVMSWKTRTRSFIWQFISFIVKSRKVYLVK